MVRRLFVKSDGEKLPQCERIGQPPRNAALAVYAFENPIIMIRKYNPGASDGRPSFT